MAATVAPVMSAGQLPQQQSGNEVPIIDIRRETTGESLKDEILSSIRAGNGAERTLPTMLLYDEAGLRLFEKITYLEEYYLTNAEIEVLTTYASHIAQTIPDGSMLIELGSGYDFAYEGREGIRNWPKKFFWANFL